MNLKNIKEKLAGKINKQNIKMFLQKQGLYVLIFLCIVAAGITAIIAWPKEDNQQISQETDQGAIVFQSPSLTDYAAFNTPWPTVADTPTPSPSPAPTGTTQPVSNGSGKMTLTKPVSGQIVNKFSGNSLVFYPSLNMWATHNGVDIKADKGTTVAAALSGTVSDVHTDESNGGIVVLSHSGQNKTIYAGLTNITVKAGDKVNAGQKIGEIGEMPKELDLSYHLHFEYVVNGAWMDPEKYFK
jgi:murein DD-endopeptidase MepM/ murein hydrolase activator NlpD